MLTAVRLQRLVGTNSPLAQPRRAVTASMAPKKRTRRTEPADEERNDDAHSGGSATPAEPAETGQKGAKKQKNQQSEKAVVDRDPTPRENPLPREDSLKIVSWNVAGMRALLRGKTELVKKVVSEEEPDILFMEEHKLNEKDVEDAETQLRELLPEFGDYHWAVCTKKKGYSGVAVALRGKDVQLDEIQANSGQAREIRAEGKLSNSRKEPRRLWEGLDGEYVDEGRMITLEFDEFYLVLSYVPNSGQGLKRLDERINTWERRTREYINRLRERKSVIYGGDLNVAPFDADIWNVGAKHIDKSAGTTPQERSAYKQMLEECNLVDTFRHKHPHANGCFSFWSGRAGNRPYNRGLRLDHFTMTKDFLDRGFLHDAFINSELAEFDHAPVGIVVNLPRPQQ